MRWISRFLLLSLALFAASVGANRDTTFEWTASADWPSGTTVELCANGVCASGITAVQYTLSVPVSPGEAVEGRARAHAPIDWEPDPSENCDQQQPPPNCWISDWTTVSQTWPGEPKNVTATTQSVEEMTLAATPDFWWKLDETSGTLASNSGSYGTPSDYDGTLFSAGSGGASTWLGGSELWGSGGITGGIELDNNSIADFDAIDIANALPLAGADKITISYWGERGTLVEDHRVFFQGINYNESGHQYMVGAQSGVNWRARINGATYLKSGDYYPTGEKHHFVAVLDFSLTGGELAVYVDGGTTPDFTFDVPGSAISSMSGVISTIGCSAGVNSSSRGNPWDGKLADIRIWLDAATGAEANQIYLNTLGGGGVSLSPEGLTTEVTIADTAIIQANQVQPFSVADAFVLDSPQISQGNTVPAADISQSLSLSQPSLSQAVVITFVGIDQQVTLDGTTLTQAYSLVPVAINLSQALDQAVLTSADTLSPGDLANALGLDVPSMTQAYSISPNTIASAQSVDQVALTQAYIVPTSDLSQAQTVDGTTLVQAYLIIPVDLSQPQSLDGTALVVAGALVPAGMLSDQSLASTALTQAYVINPEGSDLSQVLATVALGQASILSPNAIDISQAIDAASPGAIRFTLLPSSLEVSQSVSVASLIQAGIISTDDLSQAIVIGASATLTGDIIIPSSRVVIIAPSDRMVAVGPSDRVVTIN